MFIENESSNLNICRDTDLLLLMNGCQVSS